MFVPSVAIHQQDYSTFPLLMSIWSIIQTTLTFGQGTILVMWELIRKFWNRESLPENSEIRGGSKGGRTAEESTDDSYFQHSIIHPCYQLYSAMIYGVKNKICLSAEMEKFTHSRPVQLCLGLILRMLPGAHCRRHEQSEITLNVNKSQRGKPWQRGCFESGGHPGCFHTHSHREFFPTSLTDRRPFSSLLFTR